MTILHFPTPREKELAERNRRNFFRWRIKWAEYWAMVRFEGADFDPYLLMTGRGND